MTFTYDLKWPIRTLAEKKTHSFRGKVVVLKCFNAVSLVPERKSACRRPATAVTTDYPLTPYCSLE